MHLVWSNVVVETAQSSPLVVGAMGNALPAAHGKGGRTLLLGVHRFAPTPAAKLGLALDVLAVGVAVVVSTDGPHWFRAFWVLCAVAAFWLTSAVARHYGSATDRTAWEDVALTVVIVLSVATVLGIGDVLFGDHGPRVGRLLLAAMPALVLLRLTVYSFVRARTRPPRQLLVVGTGPLGRITGEDLTRKGAICRYLQFTGETVPKRIFGACLGQAQNLSAVLKSEVFDEVYLAGHGNAHGRELQDAVKVCETFGLPFALPAYDVRLGRAQPVHAKAIADGFLHYTTTDVRPERKVVKRVLDIAGAAAALWILAPVLVVVAALVKVTSPGPIFFRQLRVGLHGKKFHMLKFRSMVADAEALQSTLLAQNEQCGPVFKMRRDPRVTPLGRILRRYSLDELPQLANVLRGDMTLVGPRPPVPREVAQYEPWQRRRLSVPPGLTCHWQVSGRNEIAFEDWMYLDLRYVDHWTLGEDIGLLFKTVPAVVSGRGSH